MKLLAYKTLCQFFDPPCTLQTDNRQTDITLCHRHDRYYSRPIKSVTKTVP